MALFLLQKLIIKKKMKVIKIFLLIAAVATLLLGNSASLNAQVTVGSNKNPEKFSLLELKSNSDKGLRLPQMTTVQRDAMADETFRANTEAMGLQIFNTTTHCVETWNGTVWISACWSSEEPCNNTITGPEYISIPNTGVAQTYSVDVPEATSYVWSVPSGWTITLGQGTATIKILPATTVQAGGTISVKVNISGSNMTCSKEIKACGAYIDNDVWSNFMCHNLGADETADPFTPSQDIVGDYYQWGDAMPQGTKDSFTSPWPSAPGSYYGDNTNNPSAKVKSPTDPCPPGYRVPNQDELNMAVVDAVFNSVIPKPETFWVDDDGGYNGDMFGDALFLPAAGYRGYRGNGALTDYNLAGNYWSSTLYSTGAYGANFDHESQGDASPNRAYGYSIRCIAQ